MSVVGYQGLVLGLVLDVVAADEGGVFVDQLVVLGDGQRQQVTVVRGYL